MRQHLTDLTVRSLPHPESGDTKYWDTVTPGFGVRVTSRSKSFFVVRGEKRQLTTIGRYPAISLQDARKEAKRLLATYDGSKASVSHSEALGAYLDDCRKRLRPRTVEEYERPLRQGPDIALTDYTRKTITSTDPHVLMSWKVYFNWCVKHELVDKNPFVHTKVSYGERSRVLTDEEITIIMNYDDPPFSDILKLCLLTGQRKGEVTQFQPAWIHDDTITIPAEVAKNGKEHTIPFNLYTAQYLQRSQHVTFNGFSKAKARIDRLHPLPHWTIHDLRRTFATIHARIGTPIHVVEAMLNHRSGTVSGVAAIYIRHNFLCEMRDACLKYERHIATMVNAAVL